jgi:hypothetical protein
VRNWKYRLLVAGSVVVLGLVTSKKKAMDVDGSTPPKYHEEVPPTPTSTSDTEEEVFFFIEAHGPTAPATHHTN